MKIQSKTTAAKEAKIKATAAAKEAKIKAAAKEAKIKATAAAKEAKIKAAADKVIAAKAAKIKAAADKVIAAKAAKIKAAADKVIAAKAAKDKVIADKAAKRNAIKIRAAKDRAAKTNTANHALAVKRKELGMLDKGTIAAALISSSDRPFNNIPVKCVIEDAYFVDTTLFYVIKIMMFYDTNTAFLLDNIRNRKFKIGKGYDAYRLIRLSNKIKNDVDINNYFTTKMTGTQFHVESCFVRQNKTELLKLFDKIQDYLIFKHLRTVENLMSRNIYNGKLKMKNENEFKIRMERGFNSLFGSNEETKEYFDLLYVTNNSLRNKLDELKGIKLKDKDI